MHGQGKPNQPEPSRPGATSNGNRAKQIYNRNLLLKIVRPIGHDLLPPGACVWEMHPSQPRQSGPSRPAAISNRNRAKAEFYCKSGFRTQIHWIYVVPIWRFGGQAFPHFEQMIHCNSTICDHSGHDSASFDSAGDDAIAPESSQICKCALI